MFLLLLVSESTSFMYKIGHSAHSNPSDEKDSWFNFSYSMIFLIQCAFRIGILMLVDTSSFRTFIDTQLLFTRSPFCIVLYGPTSTWKGDRRRLRYDHRNWTGNHPKCSLFKAECWSSVTLVKSYNQSHKFWCIDFCLCTLIEVPNLFLLTFNDLTGLDRAWWFCHHVNTFYLKCSMVQVDNPERRVTDLERRVTTRKAWWLLGKSSTPANICCWLYSILDKIFWTLILLEPTPTLRYVRIKWSILTNGWGANKSLANPHSVVRIYCLIQSSGNSGWSVFSAITLSLLFFLQILMNLNLVHQVQLHQ